MFFRLKDTARNLGLSAAAAGGACAFVYLTGFVLYTSAQDVFHKDGYVVQASAWHELLRLEWGVQRFNAHKSFPKFRLASDEYLQITDTIKSKVSGVQRPVSSTFSKSKTKKKSRLEPTLAVAVAPQTKVSAAAIASSEDLTTYRELTGRLRRHFFATLTIQPSPLVVVVKNKRASHPGIQVQAPTQENGVKRSNFKNPQPQVETPPKVVAATQAAPPRVFSLPVLMKPMETKGSGKMSIQENTQKEKAQDLVDRASEELRHAQAESEASQGETHLNTNSEGLRGDNPVEPSGSTPPSQAIKDSAPLVVPALGSGGPPRALTQLNTQGVDTQVWLSKSDTHAAPVQVPSKPHTENASRVIDQNQTETSKVISCVVNLRKFVRAIGGQETIPVVQVEDVSNEGAIDGCGPELTTGWKLASSPMHWNTLFWGTDQKIPLLSSEEALLLASRAGLELHGGMGIVLGQIAGGWTAALSGRADKPLYFDGERRLLSPNENTTARGFVFLNVAPGSQTIYIDSLDGKQTAATGIPVIASSVTAIDGRIIRSKKVQGRVLDAAPSDEKPIPNAHVKVIGQSANGFTSRDGKFELSGVYGIGDLPLYLETETKDSLTHRHRLPSRDEEATFFRFSENQVKALLLQLQGGVGGDSAIILAAAPTAAARAVAAGERIFPDVLPIGEAHGPEVYVINQRDELISKASGLGEGASRFLAIEVPEGPALVRISDKNQKGLASEIVYVSPRVINVTGLY